MLPNLSSANFSELAGLSRQVANRLLAEFYRGRTAPWHEAVLQVSLVKGRGGSSGATYQVKVSSLPGYLKDRLKASLGPLEKSLAPAAPSSRRSAEILWWTHHLKPIMLTEPRSRERREAVEKLSETPLLDWNMRLIRLSRSRIYDRLAKMDLEGMAGVARKVRDDTGQARVLVTRPYDRAVPFDEPTLRQIADNLRQQIRALIAQGVKRKLVLKLASEWLKRDRVSRGYRPNEPGKLDEVCRLHVGLYQAEIRFKAVYKLNHDRDQFDRELPRIKRTTRGMRPMEMVVMDVHPIDIRIARPDGSVGGCFLLAFMDIATRRVWCELLMVEGPGGVRNTDVIKAFLAMAQHPAFGLPEHLYCDNVLCQEAKLQFGQQVSLREFAPTSC